MKLIEKIEIKHFRSFLGTPSKFETIVNNITDLNILSGSNDSGKSNILRALNLFFNNQISIGHSFDFERDFFIGKKNAGHKVIEICISFNLADDPKRDKFLPEKFRISKFYDREGFRNYLYSFELKEKPGREIKVDSRSEKNESVTDNFLPQNPTDTDRKAAEKREWNYRVKFSGFLNRSISFEYVPAIRDKNFFAQLFGRVITRIKFNEDNKLIELQREKNKIENWRKTLTNATERKEFKEHIANKDWREERLKQIDNELKAEARLARTISNLEIEINTYSSNLIKSINFINSEFKIGKNLQDFFEGFDVGTGSDKSISLNLRGDGIQAKFVPKILDFLSRIDVEKKYFVWGFEEPENSAEYKNQQELARELKENFAKDKQIFLSTHSEEFLQLYDSSSIPISKRMANLYHVKKLTDEEFGDYSQVFQFKVDRNEFDFNTTKFLLDEDLGQSYLRAKYSKELKELESKYLAEKEQLLIDKKSLMEDLKQNNKPTLFVEDEYIQLYKIAWLKIHDIDFTKKTIDSQFKNQCPFVIHTSQGASPLAGFLRSTNVDFFTNKKVIGLFDFDEAGRTRFINLKNDTFWKVKEFGDKCTGYYKKRTDHSCFCALLLPVPDRLEFLAGINFPSFVELENLLPQDFLIQNNFVSLEVTTGATKFYKIKSDKKSKIWEKSIELDKSYFKDLMPLYDIVEELFKDS